MFVVGYSKMWIKMWTKDTTPFGGFPKWVLPCRELATARTLRVHHGFLGHLAFSLKGLWGNCSVLTIWLLVKHCVLKTWWVFPPQLFCCPPENIQLSTVGAVGLPFSLSKLWETYTLRPWLFLASILCILRLKTKVLVSFTLFCFSMALAVRLF